MTTKNKGGSMPYRTVTGPTRHGDERCPSCGAAPHHFPRGLEAGGEVVYWSCVNCDYAYTNTNTNTIGDSGERR